MRRFPAADEDEPTSKTARSLHGYLCNSQHCSLLARRCAFSPGAGVEKINKNMNYALVERFISPIEHKVAAMNQQRGTTVEPEDGCGCKVERVAEQYELSRIDEVLVSRWLGEGSERYSLRRLETHFNERVLESAMAETPIPMLDGDVTHLHERLCDGSVSAGQRAETENYLKRAGVNVERVRNDFVSHQTIHTHLRECLGATRDRTADPESRVEKADKTVLSLQNRMRLVTEETVERLKRADIVTLDSFDVYVDTTVVCGECDRSLSFPELLDRGNCRCQTDGRSADSPSVERQRNGEKAGYVE